jgi:hypothetical protein
MNIKQGDTVVILEGNPAEFIAVNPKSNTAPFTHSGGASVTCTVAEYLCIADDRCSTSNSSFVTDVNGTIFRNIIGGRPRNIVRK